MIVTTRSVSCFNCNLINILCLSYSKNINKTKGTMKNINCDNRMKVCQKQLHLHESPDEMRSISLTTYISFSANEMCIRRHIKPVC